MSFQFQVLSSIDYLWTPYMVGNNISRSHGVSHIAGVKHPTWVIQKNTASNIKLSTFGDERDSHPTQYLSTTRALKAQ